MTTHIGKEGSITVGGTAVAEVTEFNLEERTTLVNDEALGDVWETHLVGVKSWSGTLTAMLDPSDSGGQGALDNAASVSLVLYVEGTTTGKRRFSGTAGIESRTVTVAGNNALITLAVAFRGNGALTIDTVPL